LYFIGLLDTKLFGTLGNYEEVSYRNSTSPPPLLFRAILYYSKRENLALQGKGHERPNFCTKIPHSGANVVANSLLHMTVSPKEMAAPIVAGSAVDWLYPLLAGRT